MVKMNIYDFFSIFALSKKVIPSKELIEAGDYIGISAEKIALAGRGIFIFSFIVLSLFAVFNFSIFSILAVGVIPILLNHLITGYPKEQKEKKSREFMESSGNVIISITSKLKENSNLERAVKELSLSPLELELKKILNRAVVNGTNLKKEIENLAEKYSKYEPGFLLSLKKILSSFSERFEKNRTESLEKAENIFFESKKTSFESYVSGLLMPTMLIFSLGTVLPLVIVSLMPVLSFIGKNLSSINNLIFILAFILFGLFIYQRKITKTRPLGFGSITIKRNKKKEKSIFFFIAVFFFSSIPGIVYYLKEFNFFVKDTYFTSIMLKLNSLGIVIGLGISLSLYFDSVSRYRTEKRKKIIEEENNCLDFLENLSNRLSEDRSLEKAIEIASKEKNSIKIVKDSVIKMKRGFSIKESINEKNSDSELVKNIFGTIKEYSKRSIKETKTAVDSIRKNIENTNKAKSGIKKTLENYTSMMEYTAVIFAPIVCGLIVTIQEMIVKGMNSAKDKMSSVGYFPAQFNLSSSFDTAGMQLVSGLYCIFLSLILLRFISNVKNGSDEVELYSSYSKNIPLCIFIYVLSIFIGRKFLI